MKSVARLESAPHAANRRVLLEASFVPGRAGRLFCVRSTLASASPAVGLTEQPARDVTTGSAVGGAASEVIARDLVVMVAPFAEEMNRSRRFLASLRYHLAEGGVEAIMLDPYGTGDSAGRLQDASWEIWCDDLVDLVERWRAATCSCCDSVPIPRVTLLGIRSGSLLVNAVSQRLAMPVDRIVAIAAERSGDAFLRRLLRTRSAMSRMAGQGYEKVDSLRERWARGESLNLGGYTFSAALAADIARQSIGQGPLAETRSCDVTIDWKSESSSTDENTGNTVHLIQARPFWQLQDERPDPRVMRQLSAWLLA